MCVGTPLPQGLKFRHNHKTSMPSGSPFVAQAQRGRSALVMAAPQCLPMRTVDIHPQDQGELFIFNFELTENYVYDITVYLLSSPLRVTFEVP